VLTVPTAEIELQSIREHVTISNAPHGNMSVRRRNGSILKASRDVECCIDTWQENTLATYSDAISYMK